MTRRHDAEAGEVAILLELIVADTVEDADNARVMHEQ